MSASDARDVEPGQRRRHVALFPDDAGHGIATVTFVGRRWVVLDGDDGAEWNYPIERVASWPIVSPLPELPQPQFSMIRKDGKVGATYFAQPCQPNSMWTDWRTDLFVEWVPRFVDADGQPVVQP